MPLHQILSPKDYTCCSQRRPSNNEANTVKINVRLAQISEQHELARMRELLWPESSREEHRQEVDEVLRTGRYGTLPMAILVSHEEGGALTGFLEVGLRSHADGCDTAQPVGFVEGWFVHEAFRKQGIGKALMRSAEEWARNQGCHEMASDTWIDDERSLSTHQALGFEVVDRCVHFRKTI
jgi:aminoglycoside 6'-N-acetyltransferase I